MKVLERIRDLFRQRSRESASPEAIPSAAPTPPEPTVANVAPAPEPSAVSEPIAVSDQPAETEPTDDSTATAAGEVVAAEAAPQLGISLTLRLESDRGPVTVFEVTRAGATVGRAPENTIRLEDLSVSRRHARIAYRQGAFWLSDTGSMGGTWVDGGRLASARRLAPGQVIDMGVCRLTVVTVASGERSAEGASRRVVAAHPVDPAARRRAR